MGISDSCCSQSHFSGYQLSMKIPVPEHELSGLKGAYRALELRTLLSVRYYKIYDPPALPVISALFARADIRSTLSRIDWAPSGSPRSCRAGGSESTLGDCGIPHPYLSKHIT